MGTPYIFVLDREQSPKHIDFYQYSRDLVPRQLTNKGIFRLDGDELVIYTSELSFKPIRPAEFPNKAPHKMYELFRMKRYTAEVKLEWQPGDEPPEKFQ